MLDCCIVRSQGVLGKLASELFVQKQGWSEWCRPAAYVAIVWHSGYERDYRLCLANPRQWITHQHVKDTRAAKLGFEVDHALRFDTHFANHGRLAT